MKFQGFGLCGTGELVEEYEPLICKETRREIGKIFSKLDQEQIDKLINGAEAALRTALIFKNEDERSITDAIDKINNLKTALNSFDKALSRVALNSTAATIMSESLTPHQDESEVFLISIIQKLNNACETHELIAKGRADKGIERQLTADLVELYVKVTGTPPGKTKKGRFIDFVNKVAKKAGLKNIGEKLINAQIDKTTSLPHKIP